MKKEFKFVLVNSDGCIMMDTRTSSFKKARSTFKQLCSTFKQFFGGKYTIQWHDEYGFSQKKNVVL